MVDENVANANKRKEKSQKKKKTAETFLFKWQNRYE